MERSGMEAPYDGAYVVYVKEAWSGGQQATIGYTSGHVSVMPGAREAVELLANRY